MKRLLFVIPTMRMGGAEKALVSLLRSLNPEKVQVDLFLFEHGGILQSQIPDWVHILPENRVTRAMTLEFRFYWKDLLKGFHLKSAAARLRMKLQPAVRKKLRLPTLPNWAIAKKYVLPLSGEYDVAIGFLEGLADFFVIEKVTAKKKIGWIHTDFTSRKFTSEEIDLYHSFQALVTITEACAHAIVDTLSVHSDCVHVIPNITVKDDVIRASNAPIRLGWDQERLHLLTVARLERQKGIDLALEACRILVNDGAPICWHVVGDGSMREWLTEQIHAYKLQNAFILEGVQENPYPYMKQAAFIVQPSRAEGKSIVLDEAKILGKMVLTTNYPSVHDQIIDGQNGCIAEMSAESIASHIQALIQDPKSVQRMSDTSGRMSTFSAHNVDAFYRLIH